MTGRPMAPPTSWLGTAIASCTMLGIAAAALWSVTFGLRGWTAEDIRRLRVPADPPQLHALRLDTATGIPLVPWGSQGTQPRIWLVTFMYTRCPTFCTVLGIEFERLQRMLDSDPRNAGIGLLSISFDPAHDDVQALQRYATAHHAEQDRWISGGARQPRRSRPSQAPNRRRRDRRRLRRLRAQCSHPCRTRGRAPGTDFRFQRTGGRARMGTHARITLTTRPPVGAARGRAHRRGDPDIAALAGSGDGAAHAHRIPAAAPRRAGRGQSPAGTGGRTHHARQPVGPSRDSHSCR